MRLSVALLLAFALLLATGGSSPAQGAFGLISAQDGPGGIAIDVDDAGHVVGLSPTGIASPQVAIFDQNGQRIGGFEPAVGDLAGSPALDLAVTGTGEIWLADPEGNKLQQFSQQGALLREVGSAGSADGQFQGPTAIAVDSASNVYVADTGNHRIQKLSPTGVFLAKWGSAGTGPGQFMKLAGIATNSTGAVYVADAGTGRIQEFTADGSFVRAFGEFDPVPPEAPATSGTWPLATTADGSLYVRYLISQAAAVTRFSPTGEELGSFGCFFGQALATQGDQILVASPQDIGTIHDIRSDPPHLERYGDPGASMPCKALDLTADKRQSPDNMEVTVGCPDVACELTLTGIVTIARGGSTRSRRLKVRSKAISLTANAQQAVGLRLKRRRDRRRLRSLPKRRLRQSAVTVDARAAVDAANETATRSVRFKLRSRTTH